MSETEPLQDSASFASDHPDDDEWDENDNIITPGGFAITISLIKILRSAGIYTSPPQPHEDHAWVFDAKWQNISIECMIQPGWLLLTIPHGGFFFSRKNRRQFHIEVLKALRNGMNASKGFSDVIWGTREELAAQGKL
ncbi:MAG TPA: hypothetical protein VG733_12685 [Chthoniobacteraceae bacterium]|nr:hypothetical protein [Chthoniobacteraceae bacterium]